MGLFEMSLINQMLQDLEGRRTEGTDTGVMQSQIRAVPERSRRYVVLWIVLAALLLAGAAVWLWLRQTAPVAITSKQVVPPAPPSQLISKPAPVVSVPAPVAQNTAAQETVAAASVPVANKGVPKDFPDRRHDDAVQEKAAVTAVQPMPSKAQATAPVKDATAVKTPAPVMVTPSVPVKVAVKSPNSGLSANNLNKQIKELTPQQRAENEYRKATALMQQGRVMETISGLESVLELDPQHTAARLTLVGLLLENKRQEEAMRKLQDGLKLDPSQSGLAMILARLQIEKGEVKPAVETLQRTLPYAAEQPDYQAFLAALLQREGLHKQAVEHYLLALRKMPENGIWWMGLGISLQAENRFPEARDAYTRAKASNTLSGELQAFVEQKLRQVQR